MKREDVIKKRFARSFCGYNMREVDEFLDELIAELDMLHKVKELDTVRIRTLLDKLEHRDLAPEAGQEKPEAGADGAEVQND